ncbi:M56 family metallopeptidase [Dyadobacter psychrotolerans]|uniref:TonB family protein n=1 Tax=Dyadobacter psychrotolerans TaxID=2541721 RepID=A0A4R5DI53_9BACT|nr:M56 family metallopeptidase [Dyadobacter psychrotolerans]TDE11584.1 TonB family protein [Dyadobacter psychrotolerans]
METLLYLGKVNFCWILFYGCYWLLFRKHTFFRWNRAFLLGSLIVSFAFPLVTFSEPAQVLPQVIYSVSETQILVTAPQLPEKTIPWLEITGLIYLAGALVMGFRLLQGFYDLGSIILRSERIKMEDYTIVLLSPNQNSSGSFSFFKWLAVSDGDYKFHLDTILNHETIHIRQWHSVDILFIELLKAAFWFNPALWFYKNSLQEVHEYLADEHAPNRDKYATFLVSYALNSPVKSLTNHFFNSSLLKSRIKMIYKNRTSRWLLGKYAMIIPVALVLISLTAAREKLLPEAQSAVSKQNENAVFQKITESEKNVAANPDVEISIDTFSQTDETISIKGSINNWQGLPVRNATIIVKNTKTGTSSDKNGKFFLDKVPVNSQIVISHVSYKSLELHIDKAKTDYKVELASASNLTEEVVVVGYGTVKTNNPPQDEKSKSNAVKPEFVIIEKQAEFPGGVDEMMKYLARNIKYPTQASRANVTGTIFISFTVNEYGNVRKPEIIKGLGFGLDDEATRVVWNMPKWSPAIQNGEAVSVQYTIPIKFDLEAPKEDKEKRQGFTNYRTKDNLQLAENKHVPISDLGKFFDYSPASANELSNKDSTSKATFTNYRYNTDQHYKVGDKGYFSTMPDGFQIPKFQVKSQRQ